MPESTAVAQDLGGHVAVLAFLTPSHAAPLLSVARHLAVLSTSTQFSFFTTPSCNSSVLSAYTKAQSAWPSNLNVYDVWDGVAEGHEFLGKPLERAELFLDAAKQSFEHGMEIAVEETGRRITCLITDAFFWFGREMAGDLGGVSWIPFWTAGSNALIAHVYTDFLREKIGTGDDLTGKEDELLTMIPGLSKARVRDLQEGVVAGPLGSKFSEMLRKMGKELIHADAVVVNSFEEMDPLCFNGLKSKFNRFLNVGPLDMITPRPAGSDTSGCLKWLQSRAPGTVAYICFGTVMSPPPNELAALAEALDESQVPFIWSLKDSGRACLPDGFLERTKSRGMVVPWAPQPMILSEEAVGVFITHGGWNSILESIAGGAPMICRPFIGDQRLNARAVEEVWQIGVGVEGGKLSKDGIVRCLEKVLFTEKGRKMKDAIKTLNNVAVKATGEGGSSLKNFENLFQIAIK